MTTILIGHRGVGKSSLLERIQSYLPMVKCFDLDQEIVRRAGRSIDEIFSSSGEKYFRELELDTLTRLVGIACEKWIAVGAGFSGGLPKDARVIWVKRATDHMGRVFFDRPRLTPKSTSALKEYRDFFEARESRYAELANEIYLMPEGELSELSEEAEVLRLKPTSAGGYVTALPMNDSRQFLNQVTQLKAYQPEAVELRDDLLNSSQQKILLEEIGANKLCLSIRNQSFEVSSNQFSMIDWALELGVPRKADPSILSVHERNGELKTFLSKIPTQSGAHIKLAVEIHSFAELLVAHQWQQQSPETRSFLPRSSTGRWKWYRQIYGMKHKISFWRLDKGSAPDQPTLFEWLSARGKQIQFAAVLGEPVDHSFTPIEQRSFFAKHNMSVVAVPCGQSEFTSDNLRILHDLGLQFAAVTSPLKTLAAKMDGVNSPRVEQMLSANTLAWQNEWQKENTDIAGLKALLADYNSKSTTVWGGGGTLSSLKELLRDAQFYKSRTGVPESALSVGSVLPKVLVWAAAESDLNKINWPPNEWQPKTVVDLNYFSHSLGAEYAMKVDAQYFSGHRMFKVQAEAQRKFWQQYLREF